MENLAPSKYLIVARKAEKNNKQILMAAVYT